MVMLQMQVMANLCLFNDFRKHQKNKVNIFSRKCNGLKKDDKL